jgi:uncharacterized membrane protein YjgN (DUF898 family)
MDAGVYDTAAPVTATRPAPPPLPRLPPPLPVAPQPLTGEVGTVGLSWRRPVGFFGLAVINLMLNIGTLGLYQFWAKAEVRKRIWASVRLAGDPLGYSGSGRELLTGFLTVFVVLIIPAILLPTVAVLAFGQPGLVAAQIGIYAVFGFMFGLAVWRAHRYRLRRTWWRGIRGDLVGNQWEYAWTSFWTALMIPLTLGWILPWRSARLQRLITEGMRLGSARFSFAESAGPLYARFLLVWLVNTVLLVAGLVAVGMLISLLSRRYGLDPRDAPVTIETILGSIAVVLGVLLVFALTSAWYRAAQFNHFAACTSLDGVRFRGTMTGLGLMWLTLSNWSISILSAGVLLPVAQARAARYAVQHLHVVDPEHHLDSIVQPGGVLHADRGEGLAYALNFDAF